MSRQPERTRLYPTQTRTNKRVLQYFSRVPHGIELNITSTVTHCDSLPSADVRITTNGDLPQGRPGGEGQFLEGWADMKQRKVSEFPIGNSEVR